MIKLWTLIMNSDKSRRWFSFIIRQNAIENILTLLFAEWSKNCRLIWAQSKPSTRDDMANKS